MTEPTIPVHHTNGDPNTLTKSQFEALRADGMLYEFHPDAPEYWPYPIPSPDSMHGAADGFGGQDTPHSPSVARLRADMEPVGEIARLNAEKADLLLETILLRQVIERIERADHQFVIDNIIAEWRDGA